MDGSVSAGDDVHFVSGGAAVFRTSDWAAWNGAAVWSDSAAFDRYAEILEIRHHGQLTFDWQLDPAALTQTVPRSLLQPIVENAVLHGALRSCVPGRVTQCLSRLRARCPRLQLLPRPSAIPSRIVARDRKRLVFLRPEEVWAFESEARLTFVHTRSGRYDLDLSLSAIEASVGAGFLRVHRSWLVHLEHVRGLDREEGESSLLVGDDLDGRHRQLTVPVARERAQVVREHLLASATGLRKP